MDKEDLIIEIERMSESGSVIVSGPICHEMILDWYVDKDGDLILEIT